MPKKPKAKRNPADPMLLAREVVETAIRERLFTTKAKSKKYSTNRKKTKR